LANSSTESTIKFDKILENKHYPIVVQPRTASLPRAPLNSTVPRNNQLFSKSNKAKIPRLKAPYRKREMDRFEDTYRTDGTVRNGINKKWNFILGANTSVNLDVNKEFQTDDERAAQLQKVLAFPEYQKAKDKANEVLRKTNFRYVIHSAGVSASVYGRSCVEKVRDSAGNIVRLNILNSKLLGDVKVNPETWEFLGVQYRDLPHTDDVLWAKDIIYITRNDVHISPGSLYYGLSDLEPVIDSSETKRIILQEDLKEISKGAWAGFLWMKFKNPNVTAQQIQEIAESVKPGAAMATDQDVDITVDQVTQESPMLLNMINELNLEIGRTLSIPSPLIGYENSQNYSNLVQTLIAWKESDLNAERRWLCNIIEKQLLNEIFRNELKKMGIILPESLDQDVVVQRNVMNPALQQQQQQQQQQQGQSSFANSFKVPSPTMPFPNKSPIAAAAAFPFNETNKSPDGKDAQRPNISKPDENKQEPNKPNNIQDKNNTNNDNNDPTAPISLTLVIPPAKLTYEVEDPNFETQEKKVATALQLYGQDLISARKVLETVDMEDQVEETELRLQQKEIREQEMFNFQQNVFQNQIQTNGAIQDKRGALLQRLEGELGKLNSGPSVGPNPKGVTPPQLQGYQAQKKPRFGSVMIDDVDDVFVNNIQDVEIKDLYKQYLKAKTKAFNNES
jgi:hypothetical protein